MRRFRRPLVASLALAAAAASLAAACRDVNAPIENPAATTYAPALAIDLTQPTWKKTASGIYYQDAVIGSGKQVANDSTLKVYYTGWLTTGQTFDSNVGKTVFSFALGKGAVIKGWDEGIIATDPMRVGGRRRLVIPPALGYGSATSGKIPAGSVLVFDVTLVGVGS